MVQSTSQPIVIGAPASAPACSRTCQPGCRRPVQPKNPPACASTVPSVTQREPARRSSLPVRVAAGARNCPQSCVHETWARVAVRTPRAGLLCVRERHEAALEACDLRLVAVKEVDEQVDARGLVHSVCALADVLRLQCERHAEQPVRRVALVAVLGEPDARTRPAAGNEAHELVDRRHRDRRAPPTPAERRRARRDKPRPQRCDGAAANLCANGFTHS